MSAAGHRVPASAGRFTVERRREIVRGRAVRTCALVFTTHDGFVGESIPRQGRFDHRAAYENALAARAGALLRAGQAAANRVPVAHERCNKPAPVAQLLNAISEHLLFGEVERRGWAITSPDSADVTGGALAGGAA